MRYPRGLVAVLLSFAAVAPASAIAPPTSVNVQAREEYFLPSIVSLARGGTVTWDFSDAFESHTATDDTGMALYDSGIVHPGGPSFSYTFTSAGSYDYVCTLHIGMDGHADVPMRAAPPTGATSSTYTVTWSSAAAATDFVFDVRSKRKGRIWRTWQDGVTVRQAVYSPGSAGTYLFRSRLRRVSTGESSGWSAAVKIVVS